MAQIVKAKILYPSTFACILSSRFPRLRRPVIPAEKDKILGVVVAVIAATL